MAVMSIKDETKTISGSVPENIYWEFKTACATLKLTQAEGVEMAAKFLINEHYKKIEKEDQCYDISVK